MNFSKLSTFINRLLGNSPTLAVLPVKFYTFHWAQFYKGQVVTQGDWFYSASGGYPKTESLMQQMKDLIDNQSAEITVKHIKEVSKAKFDLLKGNSPSR